MRPVLFPILFGVIGASILIALGVWQVQRLAWKQGVLAEIEARIGDDPVPLPAEVSADRDRYMPVRLSGMLGEEELHVLVSIKRFGPGYRVIAPLTLDDGRRVMLDRGFVPTEDKSRSREIGAITVTGNLHWPRETDGFTPEPDPAGKIWFARDVPAMAETLKTEPIFIIADARSKTDPNVTPLPVDKAGIPNDHLQYAITWFSLAVIWLKMTVYFLRRNRAKSESDGT